jgi:UDP-glucose 4-epimerase
MKSNYATDDYRQKYAGVRAIVLGSTGFIGRWVARGLCNAGAKVFLPVRDRVVAEVIFNEYGVDGDIYEMDLRDFGTLQSIYKDCRPTVTFNLAGYGVDRDEQNEELAFQINSDLVKSVCVAISQTRDSAWTGRDIVNVGTAMEYGLAGGNLAEDSLARPATLYGKSKLAGTQSLADCCRRYRIKGVTARLFSVYGPGELPGRLLPTLIQAARHTADIPLTEGKHKRDFVYVEDVAEILLRLGSTSPQPGEVVNLATGTLNTVRTFVETAADNLGIGHERLKFGMLPTRLEEMNHESVTNRRLSELTGLTPKTTISHGIRKTLLFDDFITVQATVGRIS